MFRLSKPHADELQRFFLSQSQHALTYEPTPDPAAAPIVRPRRGFQHDSERIVLGNGEKAFQAARQALCHWQQFQLDWVECWPADVPIRAGECVLILARVLGIWTINACRIVTVIDEQEPVRRFGFLYATLPGHAECGEELFLLEWNHRSDGIVTFQIIANSRPQHVLVRASAPYARRLQARFRRQACQRLRQAVALEDGGTGRLRLQKPGLNR